MSKRLLYSNIWESVQFSKLSEGARLLYIGTITLADDDGILKGAPSLLRSKIFPLDEDIKTDQVRKWREDIVGSGLIVLYEVNGEEYLYHPNWLKFQSLRNDMYKKSEFPPPPNMPLQTRNESVTKSGRKRPSNITKHNLTQQNIYAQTSFENFWSEYPNKTAKKKAYEIWEKINPDEKLYEKIMDALKVQKKSPQWTKDDGRFIPHPTTWLNQERWNDEPPKKQFATGGTSDRFKNVGRKV